MKKLLTGGLLAFALMFGVANVSEQPINAAVANKVVKDKKKRITKVTKFYNNKKTKQIDTRTYQGNTKKLKKKTIINYNGKSVNSRTKGYVYTYNKAGQLKTNKKGKATRTDYKYFLNNKVSAKRVCTYNARGKLKCKAWNTKSYKKNKAVAVYKTVPATYKTITVTPAQPAKPAVTKQVWQDATKDTYLYTQTATCEYHLAVFAPMGAMEAEKAKALKETGANPDVVNDTWVIHEYWAPKGLAVALQSEYREYGYDCRKGGTTTQKKAAGLAIGAVFGPLMDKVDDNIFDNRPDLYGTTNMYDQDVKVNKTLIKGKPAGYQTITVTPAVPAKAAVTKKELVTPAKKVLVRYK